MFKKLVYQWVNLSVWEEKYIQKNVTVSSASERSFSCKQTQGVHAAITNQPACII